MPANLKWHSGYHATSRRPSGQWHWQCLTRSRRRRRRPGTANCASLSGSLSLSAAHVPLARAVCVCHGGSNTPWLTVALRHLANEFAGADVKEWISHNDWQFKLWIPPAGYRLRVRVDSDSSTRHSSDSLPVVESERHTGTPKLGQSASHGGSLRLQVAGFRVTEPSRPTARGS